MAKKEKPRKEEVSVYASPSWSLKRDGQEIKFNSPAGVFPYAKEGMVEIRIMVEEI